MSAEAFDYEEHERQVSERYAQLAKYDAFDQLVDMALDGVITIDEALAGFKYEFETQEKTAPI